MKHHLLLLALCTTLAYAQNHEHHQETTIHEHQHTATQETASMEIKTEAGKIYQGEHYQIVKKTLKAGEKIPRHNHPGDDIIFTVLTGKVDVFFNDKHFATASPGDIIRFDGENYINADILEDAQIQIALIHH